MAQQAIALPFSIDSFGNISKSDTPQKFWGDKVKSVVGTAIQERVMRPTFGTRIPFSVFDNQEDATIRIQSTVEKAFDEWLPLLNLGEVSVTSGDVTGELKVLITYSLPDERESSIEVGFVKIDATNPTYEETS
jgi:phage baseplate assembly protein W